MLGRATRWSAVADAGAQGIGFRHAPFRSSRPPVATNGPTHCSGAPGAASSRIGRARVAGQGNLLADGNLNDLADGPGRRRDCAIRRSAGICAVLAGIDGQKPLAPTVLEGLVVLVAAGLLILPGLISDLVVLVLLVPPVRRRIARRLARYLLPPAARAGWTTSDRSTSRSTSNSGGLRTTGGSNRVNAGEVKTATASSCGPAGQQCRGKAKAGQAAIHPEFSFRKPLRGKTL